MRNLLSIFVLGLLMASCISMGQYNALPKDQMTWYDVHSVWMEAPVPDYVDHKMRTEAKYFLSLPSDLKRQYIKVFWKLRGYLEDDLRPGFYARLDVCNKFFGSENGNRGYLTDRGRLFMLLGYPDDIRIYNGNREETLGSIFSENDWMQSGAVTCWSYLHNGEFVSFYFEKSLSNAWVTYHNLRLQNTGGQQNIREYYSYFYSPPSEGWDIWCRILLGEARVQ